MKKLNPKKLRLALRGLVARNWGAGVLALVFVAQIHVFNYWTGLGGIYWPRRSLFSLGLAAILFGPAMLFNRRFSRNAYLLLVSAGLTAVFVSQYLFFAYSGSFLQASVIRYLGYAGQVAGSVKTLPLAPLGFFASLAVAALVVILQDKKPPFPKSRQNKLVTAVMLLAMFGAGLGFVSLKDIQRFGDTSRIFNNPFDNGSLIKKVGIVGYSILDLRRYLATPRGISEAERQFVKDWAASHPLPPTEGNYFGLARNKNVILIQSESFERFLLGRAVGGQEITPNLNRFRADSLSFPNFFYVIGPGHTVDAEFTTTNSLYPLQDRVIFFEYPQHQYQTIMSQLKGTGYEPIALHANNGSFWNRLSAYPAQGFDKFYDQRSFSQQDEIGWGISDNQFFIESAAKLAQTKQPFFAYLVTLTQHTPFDLPTDKKALSIDKGLGLNWIQEAYIQLAHYYDSAFGELINQLKQKGLYDSSIIALDGDHTAFLTNEDDANFARFLGLKGGFSRTSLVENTQVPFMMHVPGSALKGEIAAPGSHLDIYPTLANLLGLKPPGSVMGQDLLNTQTPVAVSLRFNTKIIDAIMTGQLFYVASAAGSFDTGQCLNAQSKQPVSLERCRPLYDEALAKLKVSEYVVRGDAVDLLNNR